MRELKEIIKSLWKRKLSSLLLCIQIVVSLFIFILIACVFQQIVYLRDIVPSNLDTKEDSIIHMMFAESTSMKSFSKLSDYINSIDGVQTFNNFRTKYLEFPELDGDENGEVNKVCLGQGMELIKHLDIIEGRPLEDKDYEQQKGNKPVVVGYQFYTNNGLSIGSEIKDQSDTVYEIVGVLKEGSNWFFQSISDALFQSLDYAIVAPTWNQEEEMEVALHYYCVIEDPRLADQIQSNIKTYASEHKISMESEMLQTELQENLTKMMDKNIKWLVFCGFFIFATSIGTATVILSALYTRKREIGIRIALGYSIAKLKRLFVGQISVITLLAFIIATILSYIIIGPYNSVINIENTGMYMSCEVLAAAFFIAVIISIPTTVALLYKLNRIQPREVIGGRE
ncbi:MAG: ABC transporter permease [bacterium]|nr:ABC transporter permease [bacterium]